MEKVKSTLTHRQRQALATRQLIVDTACELFLAQGYRYGRGDRAKRGSREYRPCGVRNKRAFCRHPEALWSGQRIVIGAMEQVI
jgi:hypothetical protein